MVISRLGYLDHSCPCTGSLVIELQQCALCGAALGVDPESAAMGVNYCQHITFCLWDFHWLLIFYQAKFKVLALTYMALFTS